MKRTIVWLLVLSMILSLMPGIPLTASASTADDPNYHRFVSLRWGENGEYYWDAGYDHEQQLEYIRPSGKFANCDASVSATFIFIIKKS